MAGEMSFEDALNQASALFGRSRGWNTAQTEDYLVKQAAARRVFQCIDCGELVPRVYEGMCVDCVARVGRREAALDVIDVTEHVVTMMLEAGAGDIDAAQDSTIPSPSLFTDHGREAS